ncbi:MAG TPA: RNA polymerase sigma factor, partial [Acidobacteriota bacterium]
DYLRRNKARRTELGSDVLAAVPAAAQGSDPQREHARREFRHRVDRSLAGLSPRQRMIFLLKHDQQFSIREIAVQLQCTEGSVKTHLFRAVSAIKRGFKNPALEDLS